MLFTMPTPVLGGDFVIPQSRQETPADQKPSQDEVTIFQTYFLREAVLGSMKLLRASQLSEV